MDCLKGSRGPEMRRRSMIPRGTCSLQDRQGFVRQGYRRCLNGNVACRLVPLLALDLVPEVKRIFCIASDRRISIMNSIIFGGRSHIAHCFILRVGPEPA